MSEFAQGFVIITTILTTGVGLLYLYLSHLGGV